MRDFSFIHTADLHLDSPFSGLRRVDGEVAGLLRDATFQAFNRIVDLALSNKVDFLLVAGDVYDSVERSLRAQLRFADGLGRLADAGISSFVCHGNHDPLEGWSASLHWPNEVYVFGPELESVSLTLRDGTAIRIHGVSYPHSRIDESFGRGFQRRGPEPFQIGLLHCSVGSDPAHETYAPRTIPELLDANLDYWALGHVHTQKVLKNGHPFIAYPGTPQGRNIRESGPRGCLLVHASGTGQVSASFEPVDAVRWYSHELSIDDFETEGELLEALEKVCENNSSEAQGYMTILRVILRGRGQLHSVLGRTQVVEDLTDRLREIGLEYVPPVWIERIMVNTSTAIDLDSRRQSADFLGEVLRVIDASRREPKEVYEFISHLYEDRRGRRFLKTLAESDLLEILQEVERMCLDELVQEESP